MAPAVRRKISKEEEIDHGNVSIHPAVDQGLKPAAANFAGGTLSLQVSDNKVTVSIKGQAAYNHVCGCTKCWKPGNALFSQIAVTPRANLKRDRQ